MITFMILTFLIAFYPVRWIIIYLNKQRKVKKNTGKDISIIIPLKGWDNSLPNLLASLCEQGKLLNLEILIIADIDNPSLNLIPKDPNIKVIFSQGGDKSWKDKNWRLYQGAKLAEHPLILFLDSDVIVENDFLARRLASHTEEFSFCLPFYSSPANAAERFLAAFTNYNNITIYKTSFKFINAGTAIGPSILFSGSKQILLQALESCSGEIADDHAIANWFHAHGYQIQCVDQPVFVSKENESWIGAFRQIMRWILLPRTVKHIIDPITFLVMGFNIILNMIPAILILLGSIISWEIAGAGISIIVIETIGFIFLESNLAKKTKNWFHAFFLPFTMIVSLFVVLASFFKTKIYWRGQIIPVKQ